MRSIDSTADSPVNEILIVTQTSHDITEEEDGRIMDIEKSIKVKSTEDEEKTGTDNGEKSVQKDGHSFGLRDLPKDDLLKVLGIMEGEIQAREDVIRLLRSELLSRPEKLESRYGSARPIRPLQALQRDAVLSSDRTHHHNVSEKPMAELDRLQDKHKESYQRMLEQLLLAEKSHRHTVYELETEKRKHVDYMNKSDDFTNLLEQERERLKRLLKQEKAYQTRKEKDFSRRMRRTSGELVKLKSFAMMMVDERELHLEKIDKQSNKIKDLLQKLQEKEQKLDEAERKKKEDSQKILNLEVELELRTSKFAKEEEEMSAKLSCLESQHQQLAHKQIELSCKNKELEETNNVLQRSAEKLQELRMDECGNLNLMAELETLHKRILEMEGKDEELTKTENKCDELKKKLHAEDTHNKELRLELERMQERMTELEKLEMTFNTSRAEYSQLQAALEKEKSLTKDLTNELVSLKIRMKELESSELKLEKDELDLKEDLMKLKSVTVVMVNEHRNMADRIRSEDKKKEELMKLHKSEQEKVMEVTERLIEESKNRLKLKSEMELEITNLVKDRDGIKDKFTTAEEKCKDLRAKLGTMKHTTATINEEQRESTKKAVLHSVPDAFGNDANKVKELTLEIEQMKNRLHHLEAHEGDLVKSEEECEMLEKTELEKAKLLSPQVNKKGSHEDELRRWFILEEITNRDLQADMQALKEKIHVLMSKEEEFSQLQVDYSMLQQRFLEEEDKKKSISNEVSNLTKELEVTKRHSRTLRTCTKGSKMMEVPMTSTGVQTDLIEKKTADNDSPAAFIKKSVQEENRIMSGLQQKSLKKPQQRPTVRELYPPTDLTVKKSWIPWMKKKDSSVSEISLGTGEESVLCEVNTSKSVQVIPDLGNSEATLQTRSSCSDDSIKRATAAQSQAFQRPQTTIIPTNDRTKEPNNPERARSPVAIATISRVKSPGTLSSPCIGRSLSPVPIASNNSSPEPVDMITGRAVFKVTPEKRMVPTPIKKCSSHANVVTTEDSKIHSGSQFKKSTENHGSVVMPKCLTSDSKEASFGSGLRSAPSVTVSKSMSKLTSSLSITQVTKAPARPTLSVQPVLDSPSVRSGLTRIPMSRGMKTGKAVLGALGIGTSVKMETHAENQTMNTELKKATLSNGPSQGGGKG
ncbi:filamin-A-interacting protein 1 [Triplophysa dalaica]|uniref:filamin-A-interacting protein 1 n=1 Tax=Triplophysa dalaica TaxID=1582913 RepID=UPI0024E0316F|nr:filamin-A-interacting protein 1 [Triplophysa dalaica]XP_056623210.1 filamin-A-interacting protein 1 [Triplophysa dalaica]XP_056623211.1 filamin-A-interacting protein 1 [Triplophysa dalaica]XP_056623212.1 filamin-A-interacting protein 1 [Triplophysa dalaica]